MHAPGTGSATRGESRSSPNADCSTLHWLRWIRAIARGLSTDSGADADKQDELAFSNGQRSYRVPDVRRLALRERARLSSRVRVIALPRTGPRARQPARARSWRRDRRGRAGAPLLDKACAGADASRALQIVAQRASADAVLGSGSDRPGTQSGSAVTPSTWPEAAETS